MVVRVSDVLYSTLVRQGVVSDLRSSLIGVFGDRKWLVKFVDELNSQEEFGTSDEEFARKFQGSPSCEADDSSDCDCVFEEPKVGVVVQYNTKYGAVDEGTLQDAVKDAWGSLVVGELSVCRVVEFSAAEEVVPVRPGVAVNRMVVAVNDGAATKQDVVSEVLAAVLAAFPAKSADRSLVEDIMNRWGAVDPERFV